MSSLAVFLVVVLVLVGLIYGTNYHGNVDPYAKRWLSLALLVVLVLFIFWALVGFGGTGPYVRFR